MVFWILIFIIFFMWLLFSKKEAPSVNEERKRALLKYSPNKKYTDDILYSAFTPEQQYKNIVRHGNRCYIEGLNFHEKTIVQKLAEGLDPADYYIFNNIIIPSSTTTTTQIDHVVVSKYGIFVIESKDYSGWIFGNSHHKQWTQTFPKVQKNLNGQIHKKYHFKNPIHQNYGHIMSLRSLFPFVKREHFYNIIVFSDKCVFKTPIPENIIYDNQLIAHIKNINEIRLKEVEVLLVIGKLSMLCQTVDVLPGEHVRNILKHTEQKV